MIYLLHRVQCVSETPLFWEQFRFGIIQQSVHLLPLQHRYTVAYTLTTKKSHWMSSSMFIYIQLTDLENSAMLSSYILHGQKTHIVQYMQMFNATLTCIYTNRYLIHKKADVMVSLHFCFLTRVTCCSCRTLTSSKNKFLWVFSFCSSHL